MKTKYALHGHILHLVSSANYLDYAISSDLKWRKRKHLHKTNKLQWEFEFLKLNLPLARSNVLTVWCPTERPN